MKDRGEIFKLTYKAMREFHIHHFYNLSIEHLNHVLDENSPAQMPSDGKTVLNLTQTGLLYNINPNQFKKGYFDDHLLNFLSEYRDKMSFTFYNTTNTTSFGPTTIFRLDRITITNLKSLERDKIGEFMANNLDKYPNYVRQTVNFKKYIDDERIINPKQLTDQDFINNRGDYKDLTLIFGGIK